MPTSKQSSRAHYNISQNERKALKTLLSNKKLIIKEADKGAAVVIMSKEYYAQKSEEILEDSNFYEKLESNNDSLVM